MTEPTHQEERDNARQWAKNVQEVLAPIQFAERSQAKGLASEAAKARLHLEAHAPDMLADGADLMIYLLACLDRTDQIVASAALHLNQLHQDLTQQGSHTP